MGLFNLQGKKNYKVLFINGGTGQNGRPYTFLTVEDMPEGKAQYGDKMKINLWGEDLSQQIKSNDYIRILGCMDVGMVRRKDSKTDKWYENLTITCQAGDIVLGEKPAKKEEKQEKITEMQPIDSMDELPFSLDE